MAYMNKRGVEAMGDVVMNPFTGLPMDSSLPPGADYTAPTTSTDSVYCWNGTTGPASACPPQPTSAAAPQAASSGLSTTTLLVIGGVGVAAYFLTKKKRR